MKFLRMGEAIGAIALPLVLAYHWSGSGVPVAWALRGPAVALLSFILLQGVLYWHLKLRSCDERQRLPTYFRALFRSFQYVNMLAIGAMLVVLASSGAARVDLVWSWGIVAFSILEHINYYHYQLMYDTRAALASLRRNGRLRKAALAVDLSRSR